MNDVANSLNKNDTFPKLLLHHAKVNPTSAAYRQKHLGIWQTLTWAEAAARVELMALGLHSLGLKPNDKVAIVGQNTTSLYLSFKSFIGIITLISLSHTQNISISFFFLKTFKTS